MLEGIVSAFIWFTLFWLIHIGIFHFLGPENRSSIILRLFGAAIGGHLVSMLVLPQIDRTLLGYEYTQAFLGGLCGLVLLFCLFVLYMPFYYTIATSLSVQTVILLKQAPTYTLPIANLMDRFASETILGPRFDSMVASGYLWKQGDKYRLTPKGQSIARFFNAIKKLWKFQFDG